MIIKFKEKAKPEEIALLRDVLHNQGFSIHESTGTSITLFGVIGDTSKFDPNSLYVYDFIETVLRVQEPYKQVNRKFHPEDTIIDVKGVQIEAKTSWPWLGRVRWNRWNKCNLSLRLSKRPAPKSCVPALINRAPVHTLSKD